MLIVDAHEDIAWNVLSFGRAYEGTVEAIREYETGTAYPSYNGHTLLGRDAWLAGQVAVIFGTLFAAPARHRVGDWDKLCYRNPQEAYDLAGKQLDVYRRMADGHPGFQVIGSQAELSEVLATWPENREDGDPPGEDERRIGIVPLMEGADPIVEPEQAEEWFERGIRIVGPAWKSTRYTGGTGEPGPLTALGHQLLDVMGGLGMILDLSHMAEEACLQALDRYEGTIIASHSNPRRFFPERFNDRGLSDEVIGLLAERGGIIGVVPYNAFLDPDWYRGAPKEKTSLLSVVDAIDHICQVTGSADHVGIGSDFDGGFGWDKAPAEIDTVADLQKLIPLLTERGYRPGQIEAVMGGNWLRLLNRVLPE